MPVRVSRASFERLVDRALESLPDEFRRLMTNVSVIVEDYPSREDAEGTGSHRDELLGLFAGVSYPHKGGFLDIPPPFPDEIVIFQRNIQAICATEEELVEEIRKTVVHEVGHYFGMSEEDLEEYE